MRLVSVTLGMTLLMFTAPDSVRADYWVDFSDQHIESEKWNRGGSSIHGVSCETFYGDGIVRSWSLREKNRRDFRRSRTYCKNMREDGTLAGGSKRVEHFSYEGTGVNGKSGIPMDELPVGVRTTWQSSVWDAGNYKLADVAMLSDPAFVIERQGRNFDDNDWRDNDRRMDNVEVADYALGRGLERTNTIDRDVMCRFGYVLTGVWVKARHRAGGPNSAEIRGVKIECSRLVEY